MTSATGIGITNLSQVTAVKTIHTETIAKVWM